MSSERQEFLKLWVQALRSGKYRQGQHALFSGANQSYCCLGVACMVAKELGIEVRTHCMPDMPKIHGQPAGLDLEAQPVLRDFLNIGDLGLLPDSVRYLTELNDSGASFDVIANLIEKELIYA